MSHHDEKTGFSEHFSTSYSYNPAVFRQIQTWGESTLSKEEFAASKTLIEPCACCGQGRTLFVHLAYDVNLVVEADFRKWCKSCRDDLAKRQEKFLATVAMKK